MNKVTETMISNVDKPFIIGIDSDIMYDDQIEQVPENLRIKRTCDVKTDFDVDDRSIGISSTKRNDKLNTCTIDMDSGLLDENQHVQGLECSSFKRSGDINNTKARYLRTPEQDTSTKRYLHPILFLLACGGCYNFNRIKGIENGTNHGGVKRVASFVYRTFVGITVLTTLIKFIVGSFFIIEESLVENGLSITWHTMCACHYLVHIKADSVRYGHRKKCFESFDDILDEFNNMGITFPAAKVKRWMKRASIVGWSLVLANMSGNVLRGVFHDQTRDLYTAPIPDHQINGAPFRSNELFLVIFYIAEIFVTTVWMSSFVYIMAICYLFICAFDSFNICLKETVKGKSVHMNYSKDGSQDGKYVEAFGVNGSSGVNACKIDIVRGILDDNKDDKCVGASSVKGSADMNTCKIDIDRDILDDNQYDKCVEASSVKRNNNFNTCIINFDRDNLDEHLDEQSTSFDASSANRDGNVNNLKPNDIPRIANCSNRNIQDAIAFQQNPRNCSLKQAAVTRISSKSIDLHKLRLLHLKLCDLVGDFDADMRWFFGSTCFLYLGLLCVCLFKLVKTSEMDAYTLMMYLFWMATGAAILGLVAILAALVNEKAHAALDCIFHVDVIKTEPDQVTQLTLFLSKLTGTQVGFTTCGLLTITKEFILSILGVFLTYFAVLYTL